MLSQFDMSDEDRAIANNCFDNFRFFVSLPDFYDSLFDGTHNIPILLDQLLNLGLIESYEYDKLSNISNAVNSAISLSITEEDFYNKLLTIRDDVMQYVSDHGQNSLLFVDGVLDIAVYSMDFWLMDENQPYTGRNEYAPPVVAADVGGALLGAAKTAVIQYVTNGNVNGKGVLLGAGTGAVVASTGGALKVGSAICKTAERVGKFIRKLF